MDDERFDALARGFGNGGTRRALLCGGAASALAWLGLTRTSSHSAGQDETDAGFASPVMPICTCPQGLVLCQGLCVNPADCEQESDSAVARDGAAAAVSGGVAITTTPEAESACPAQEKFCPAKGICVPCPTTMSLDTACRCTCRNKRSIRAATSCACPKIAECACVCPGPPCIAPKLQDAETCACICPMRGPCHRGMVFDEATCNCVCPVGQQLCNSECVTCPPGANLDDRCSCRCPAGKALCRGKCVDACPAGQSLSRTTCQCSCPAGSMLCKGTCIACPHGTKLNLDTCACACSVTMCGEQCCGEDQICDTRTEPPMCCTPHNTCPLEGHCGPVSDNCGGVLDLGPCPDQACHTGFCQPGDLCNACVYQEVRNDGPGPLCDAPGESCCGGVCCTAGQICQNGVCCAPNETCPCARTCPPGQPLDPASCTCGCPKGMQRCQGTCVECPEGCCPDPGSCGCVCPDCLENFDVDLVNCACTCTPKPCPPYWSFDETSCDCVCSPTPCAPGSGWQFDQASCSCICVPVGCPANFVFDEGSCSCVCVAQACAANLQFDDATCSCVCIGVACAEGAVFDALSCSCLATDDPGGSQGTD